jgi:hypothetical protein
MTLSASAVADAVSTIRPSISNRIYPSLPTIADRPPAWRNDFLASSKQITGVSRALPGSRQQHRLTCRINRPAVWNAGSKS